MLLATIMLSTTVIAAFPTFSFASNSATNVDTTLKDNIYAKTEDSFEILSQLISQINYDSAADMLAAEKEAKQLVSARSADERFMIHVNAYTGFMYYEDTLTGQVLMSNYYNYADFQGGITEEHLSQIKIEYAYTSDSKDRPALNSYQQAARNNQIYVTVIDGGIRVNYTIGDTKLRYLVPETISQERYFELILLPIFKAYADNVKTVLRSNKAYKDNYTFDSYLKYYNAKQTSSPYYGQGFLFNFAANVMGAEYTVPENYREKTQFVTGEYEPGVTYIQEFSNRFKTFEQLLALDSAVYYCTDCNYRNTKAACTKCGNVITPKTTAEMIFKDETGRLNTNAILYYYRCFSELLKALNINGTINTDLENGIHLITTKYQFSDDGKYIECKIDATTKFDELEKVEKLINEYCVYPKKGEATYNFNEMYKDEKEFGYKHPSVQRPVFRCALEYTFNDDGTLNISLPANSISFDESAYILKSITPLMYFGSGATKHTNESGKKEGYFFYPDGCGAIVSFNDFSKADAFAPVYGVDNAYSDIFAVTGEYREQVTMPVYGSVFTEDTDEQTEVATGKKTLNNGFFAVIEEGAALAKLVLSVESDFARIHASYQPYPSDTFDLSETLAVGDLSNYTMVSATKFAGTYTTRITMLSDEALLNTLPDTVTKNLASYAGMAAVYRNYLEKTGAISAIAEVGTSLPLYIEAFGSMEVTKKILSFPVQVSEALTTFEDIRTMYDELADAKKILLNKAEEYDALAAAEEKDLELKSLYESKAAEYRTLSANISNITNVNFRLTGFANGGMKSTYPAKVKWDRAVGGESGLEALKEYADSVSVSEDKNFGIYPEFDFLYINNTAAFDGVYPNGVTSKLIDNRYAEKQLYNSLMHMYEPSTTTLVSTGSLAELYEKFDEDYSEYNLGAISASTLGSDINSDFDDEEPVNRDEARQHITSILSSMKNSGYEIMVNKGNAYTYKYVSHIVDAYVDSSHLRVASYAVPFLGMTLHGYVSYAGNALNYSGDPQYDILRSIENGASLYYILCYRNTSQMKEDLDLNKYYGVNYTTWFEKVVEQYDIINDAIGDLQTYKIVDHRILITERVIDDDERVECYEQLVNEFMSNVESQIRAEVANTYRDMNEQILSGNMAPNLGIEVIADADAIVARADAMLNLTNANQIPQEDAVELRNTIRTRLGELVNLINEENKPYAIDGAETPQDTVKVNYTTVADYASEYDYVTDSKSTAGDAYDMTKYTANNYNVVMVTYSNGTDTVRFILNYNIYSVIVTLDDGTSVVLDKYDYHRL